MARELTRRLSARIRRFGPVGFDDFMELALYEPDLGFYARPTGGGRGAEPGAGTGAGPGAAAPTPVAPTGPGRFGDFLTSPELGTVFGEVVARALDRWWEEDGRPDPWVVVEAGAGTGALAASILAARPECTSALRYVLVERSARLRAAQAHRLDLVPPAHGLGPAAPDAEEPDGPRQPVSAAGPLVTSLPDLPQVPAGGVVLANELLDNLPFQLLRRRGEPGAAAGAGWDEVRVGLTQHGALEEVLVPAAPDVAEAADRLAPAAPPGARVPLQRAAQEWLRRALGALDGGRVVVVDYADTTAGLAARPWRDWVRTYRQHRLGGHPLEHPGEQDVTCEVAVDQLAQVRTPASDQDQASFLAAHGIDELAAAARSEWQARAHIADLPALRWRSRIGEVAALTDRSGLGAFRVIEWRGHR